MGGSVNDPNLAKEWRNPGLQASQPLARPNDKQDSLSSTDLLSGDFFGEGGLSQVLRQALGSDNAGFNPDGMLSGGLGSGGGFNPRSSSNQPFIPVPSSSTQPTSTNRGSYDTSSTGGWTNSGMGGASNSNNFLSDWASSLDLGGSYNSSFFNQPDVGSSNWKSRNSLFDFGNERLGSNIPGIGDFSKANSLANKFGYGNENVNKAMGVLGLSGNSIFDYAANASGNSYLTMLNDDFSQRGIVNKAIGMSGVPYSGALMGALDYSKGYNNYGALGQGLATLAGATPLGMLGGYLLGNYYGSEYGSEYNENYEGPARSFADEYGLEPGSKEYDDAIGLFNYTMNDPNATKEQKDLVKGYVDDWTNTQGLKQLEAEDLALEQDIGYGKEGDASWSPGGGQEFHSGGYNWNAPVDDKGNDVQALNNWNATTNSGSDSFGNDISGTTDDTGATQSDYDSYDSPAESTGNTGGDGGDSDDGGYGDDSDDGGEGWSS